MMLKQHLGRGVLGWFIELNVWVVMVNAQKNSNLVLHSILALLKVLICLMAKEF